MAASGLGIALIPSSYRKCGPPGLVYHEIIDSTLDPSRPSGLRAQAAALHPRYRSSGGLLLRARGLMYNFLQMEE
jgi:hypothetical protein